MGAGETGQRGAGFVVADLMTAMIGSGSMVWVGVSSLSVARLCLWTALLRSGRTSLGKVCRPFGARSFCCGDPGFRAAHSILGYCRSSLSGLGVIKLKRMAGCSILRAFCEGARLFTYSFPMCRTQEKFRGSHPSQKARRMGHPAIEHIAGCKTQPCFVTPGDFQIQRVAQSKSQSTAPSMFEVRRSAGEMAQSLCKAALEMEAHEAVISKCKSYLWARVRRDSVALDLLLRI